MLLPELNGLLIRIFNSNSNGQEIYFVDEGKARQIMPGDKFDAMFNQNARVFDFTFEHKDTIDIGTTMVGSIFFQYDKNYYMWDENKNRHIVDPATMYRCNFNGSAKRSPTNPLDFPDMLGRPIQWIPKHNGNRVKTPNDPAIYLIDRGLKRHILDPNTYTSLFGSNDQVQFVQNLDDIPNGPELSNKTTGLVRANDQPGGAHVYLLDHGYKRLISGNHAMEAIGYGFGGGHVTNMSWFTLFEYPNGRPIVWPPENQA